MILRYRGEWIKSNKEWSKLDIKGKIWCLKEYLSGQTSYIFECLKKIPGNLKCYWGGYVDVRTQDILVYYVEDKQGHTELYELSIVCGRYNRGQYFSHIGRDTAERIVRALEFSGRKKFRLCLKSGDGVSQSYSFSKRQKDVLMEQLKPLLYVKWYEESAPQGNPRPKTE